MAVSRFVDVPEEQLKVMKENAVPRNTTDATKFEVTPF